MIKYKKIAMLIAAAMIFTTSGQAYAADLNVSEDQTSVETSIENENNNSEEAAPAGDTSKGDSEDSNKDEAVSEGTTEDVTSEETSSGDAAEGTGAAEDSSKDTNAADDNSEKTDAAEDNTQGTDGSEEGTAADDTENSEEETSTAVVTTENGITTISDTIKADETSYIVDEIFSVEPGQMIQANLTVPQDENLNYDLYLYNVETDSIVDSCTYPTYSNVGKYLDETVEFVNTASETQTYCLLINAPNGGNDTEAFTLKVGAFNTPDNYEKNYNAFNAIQIDNPLTSSTSRAGTIDSPLDNDWYVMPIDSNYSKSTIDISAGGSVNLDVYVHLGNGCFFKLTPTSTGEYAAYKGYYYYIKVSDRNGSGNYPKNYTLQTNYLASNVSISGYENGEYRSIFEMYQCKTGRDLIVKGTVTSSNGTKLANKRVRVTFSDPSFAERQSNSNVSSASQIGYTDADGNYRIAVHLPTLWSGTVMLSPGTTYSDPSYGDVALVEVDVLDSAGASAVDCILVQTY